MITAILPIRLVSVANLREHWAKKAKRTAEHRRLAGLALRHETHKCWSTIHVEAAVGCISIERELRPMAVKITRIAPRSLDTDNLASACKGLRDGIADALTVADNHPNIRWEYSQRKGRPKEYAVIVEIREQMDGGR